MSCYLLYGLVKGEVPAGQGEVPFKDVLLTVLAIAGIGIAAFGVGAYALLSKKIEANVQSKTDRGLWLARVQEGNRCRVAILAAIPIVSRQTSAR